MFCFKSVFISKYFKWKSPAVNFSKLFDNDTQSVMYRSRPEYSHQIAEEIVSFWRQFNPTCKSVNSLDIVDVGCGTGQLTKYLMPFSKTLVALDSSESQIKQAQRLFNSKNHPKFIVGNCYNIPVSDNSVDIITAAQCVHWFDIDKFYVEVDRCLKPNGVLAIMTYGKGKFIADGDKNSFKELNQFVAYDFWFDDKYLGSYYSNEPRWAWNFLPGLKFLYPNTGLRREDINIEFQIALHRYREYLWSTSMYQTWKKCNPNERDIVELALEKILTFLGNPLSGLNTELRITFQLCLIMCSKS